MQVLTREQMGIARETQQVRNHWGDLAPTQAAELVRRDVIQRGSCLPTVWFCDRPVVPVVSWQHDALNRRLDAGLGPMLYRSVLADRLAHGRDHLEPAVLRMEAFITLLPLSSARSALAAASVYAPAVAAVPVPPGAGGWDVFECDYYGFTVAEVTSTGAQTVIEGLKRAKHRSGGIGHQRRLMEEQLFDVALRTDNLPWQRSAVAL